MSEEFRFEPKHKNMARHVASGVINSAMSQAIKVLCQFASIVVLSRLLVPSDFGLVAMVSPVYGFICLFQGLGLNQATVQKAQLNHQEVSAIFWVNVAVGIALSCILFALSPFLGDYFSDPRVVSLTMAMSLLVVIGAAGNQHGSILYRRMEFRKSALIDILGTIGSLLVSVGWAYFIGGYWSIYAGMVAGILIPVMGVWIATGWMPGLPRNVIGLHEMLKFGVHMTGANIAYFIAGNIDNVLIGRYFGGQTLGLYDRAYKLLLFPLQRIVFPLGSVMIPVLSRLVDDPQQYRRIYFKTVSPLTLVTWPGILTAIILADPLISFVLGAKWANSTPLFQPLAIAGFFGVTNIPLFWLLISQGRAREYAYWSYFSAGTTIISIMCGLFYGAIGVATGIAIAETLRTPIFWRFITRLGPVTFKDMVCRLLPQITGIWVSLLALLLYKHWAQMNTFIYLLIGFTISYTTSWLTVLPFPEGRETLRQTAISARRFIQNDSATKTEK